VSASLRRLLALADATLRDLFAGRAGVLLVLACVAIVVAGSDVRAETTDAALALALERRVERLVELAAAAALLAGAHLLAEDRRTLRLAQWRATPLTLPELLLGRTVGVAGGVALAAAPLLAALLFWPEHGLVRHDDSLAPRERYDVRAAEWAQPDGQRFRPADAEQTAPLERGASLTLEFAAPRSTPLELDLPLAKALGESPGGPPEFVVSEGAVELAHGACADERLLRVPLAPSDQGARSVAIRVVGGSGVLRVELASCALLGPRGSLLSSAARSGLGLVAALLFAAALGSALGAFLPEVLAGSLGVVLLLFSTLQPLFADARQVLADPHASAPPALGVASRAMVRVVELLPDLTKASAADRLARGAVAWNGADATELLRAGLWVVGALALAAAWLSRRASGAR
jgi:hypothetical protein